ncbi:hypothetical protein CH63R_14042 [Colletotrichum higginsianum IMI 349063]|uniref:Uncharacterized protein n=1 Tax=Colletotrichum higginsianum (strain IMI 349063) TaxID=759273 RepID=A0A1B7XSU3_COLHI|nr:hypothetical protein CH63R_14042 [Colletotrichum higginsianum IMI 349063]OBR02816.1 hypothetical protein CH63R_14042 [Colletotrichum higginsianum IMI 349063]
MVSSNRATRRTLVDTRYEFSPSQPSPPSVPVYQKDFFASALLQSHLVPVDSIRLRDTHKDKRHPPCVTNPSPSPLDKVGRRPRSGRSTFRTFRVMQNARRTRLGTRHRPDLQRRRRQPIPIPRNRRLGMLDRLPSLSLVSLSSFVEFTGWGSGAY